MEEMRAVFAALSQSDGKEDHEGLITHAKLQAACIEFEVPLALPTPVFICYRSNHKQFALANRLS